VHPGSFFVVIGPNGAGKTTLLHLITGLLTPDHGAVSFYGRPATSIPLQERARRLALVPQMQAVTFPFTVAETVLMGRAPHLGLLGLSGISDRERAQAAMEQTDVVHLADRRLDRLSGGEYQRVLIARALTQEPEIMVLDEPTASLDLAHQVRVMDLLHRLQRDGEMTVVMVSHDVNLASLYADRVLLVKNGRHLCSGSPATVMQRKTLESAYGCPVEIVGRQAGVTGLVMPVPERQGKDSKA